MPGNFTNETPDVQSEGVAWVYLGFWVYQF